MRKLLPLIVFAAVAAHAQPARRRAGAAEPAGERFDVQVDGVQRTYYVYAPPGLARDKPAPVVLDFHGGGSDAATTARLTGMNRVADAHRFRVVYPEGVGKRWNDTRGLSPADDVGFVSTILDRLRRDHGVDEKRVYATGISNGGFFTTRLACEMSRRVAAIAVVAATMPERLASQCAPERPVSALFFFGDRDPLVKIDGGPVAVNRGRALSLAGAVDLWRRHDGITRPAQREELPKRDASDGTSVVRESSSGGQDGSEVVLYLIRGGGHTWPGGRPYLPLVVGVTSNQVDASETIWEFFARHPMR